MPLKRHSTLLVLRTHSPAIDTKSRLTLHALTCPALTEGVLQNFPSTRASARMGDQPCEWTLPSRRMGGLPAIVGLQEKSIYIKIDSLFIDLDNLHSHGFFLS